MPGLSYGRNQLALHTRSKRCSALLLERRITKVVLRKDTRLSFDLLPNHLGCFHRFCFRIGAVSAVHYDPSDRRVEGAGHNQFLFGAQDVTVMFGPAPV